MTCLFLFPITHDIANGLNQAVPAMVSNQAIIDDCIAININNKEFLQGHKFTLLYQTSIEYHKDFLNSLPTPFNKPDIVIFIGIYFPKYLLLGRELTTRSIPYIIQPASSLTYQAQHNHAFLKKKIANCLLFNHFIKGASAINYLTEDERKDSGTKWNKHSFVLPNGINIPDIRKTEFSATGIKACFIGRIDIYQKGLDLLLEAMSKIQEDLREAHYSLKIFGPINHDAKKVALLIKKYNINDLVSLEGEVSGAEKESAFMNSDLFVLTSRFEGHSIALLEALSYGLPVAITPGTNMKQQVQQYDAGWCCGETTIDSICNMLLTIIGERNSFASKGKQSIELAKTYNHSQIAEQFHMIAQGIVNNNYL